MQYDDYNLRKFFASLTPRNRKKVIKTACRKSGNVVRGVAVKNLRSSGIGNAARLSRGIRVVVFNREAGFRVTAASRQASRKTGKGERGMHTNRYGVKKPVLAWAETGTKWRLVKTDKPVKQRVKGKWVTLGKRRGRLKGYGFMAKTRTEVDSYVGDMIKTEVTSQLVNLAKKNGCTS